MGILRVMAGVSRVIQAIRLSRVVDIRVVEIQVIRKIVNLWMICIEKIYVEVGLKVAVMIISIRIIRKLDIRVTRMIWVIRVMEIYVSGMIMRIS
jgi:hypothetical protein